MIPLLLFRLSSGPAGSAPTPVAVVITVAAEDRVITVGAEDRTIVISSPR